MKGTVFTYLYHASEAVSGFKIQRWCSKVIHKTVLWFVCVSWLCMFFLRIEWFYFLFNFFKERKKKNWTNIVQEWWFHSFCQGLCFGQMDNVFTFSIFLLCLVLPLTLTHHNFSVILLPIMYTVTSWSSFKYHSVFIVTITSQCCSIFIEILWK